MAMRGAIAYMYRMDELTLVIQGPFDRLLLLEQEIWVHMEYNQGADPKEYNRKDNYGGNTKSIVLISSLFSVQP